MTAKDLEALAQGLAPFLRNALLNRDVKIARLEARITALEERPQLKWAGVHESGRWYPGRCVDNEERESLARDGRYPARPRIGGLRLEVDRQAGRGRCVTLDAAMTDVLLIVDAIADDRLRRLQTELLLPRASAIASSKRSNCR